MAHKCLYCNKIIQPDEEEVPIKTRYAHVTCHEIHIKSMREGYNIQKVEKTEKEKTKKTKTPKRLEDVKEGLSEEEFQQKQVCMVYLKTLIEDGKIKAMHNALLQKYMEQYSLTYLTMYQVLFYIFTILNKPVKGNPIGLVPYYIDEALDYYQELAAIEERNKDKDISKMYQRNEVHVSKRKPDTGRSSQLREWKFD